MIIKEYVLTRSDGVKIYKRYSDENKWLIQNETGLLFESAEDIEPCKYTYSEGNYFEWYIDKQLLSNYSDEKINAAISDSTNSNVAPTTVINLEKVDSEIIS